MPIPAAIRTTNCDLLPEADALTTTPTMTNDQRLRRRCNMQGSGSDSYQYRR